MRLAMTETPLDHAHAAMEATPEDDTRRLRFYERLADSELFLLLNRDATATMIDPRHIDTEDGRFVLTFDREDRLAAFAGGPAPYAALSGRAITELLEGQNLGLALNPGVAPSATMITAQALDWLRATLGENLTTVEARPSEVHPPTKLPDHLLTSIDAKLATATGFAKCAYLADVTYDDGTRTLLLTFVDALPEAEIALAQAARETLVFSGLEQGTWDVAFLAKTDPFIARLARVALRFDLPEPQAARAPVQDLNTPPRLK